MLEVVEPGLVSTVQDVLGRRPWRRYGVPLGGAADPWSARLANRLVGNDERLALIEVLGAGAAFRVDGPTILAVTGGLRASVNGIPLPADAAARVAAGARMQIGAGDGLRAYLAFSGGIELEPVLGSRATDLRTGFGGLEGRALRIGDRLPIGPADRDAGPHRWRGSREIGPVRVVVGPQHDPAVLRGVVSAEWRVSEAADRTGVRLTGSPVAGGGEVTTQGLLPGAIQLPPDGAPILMLSDCPVTGGYRVPACVIDADIGRVAQLRPGDPVTLVEVSAAKAREAWLQAESSLAALEPIDPNGDDDPAWAGSHS